MFIIPEEGGRISGKENIETAGLLKEQLLEIQTREKIEGTEGNGTEESN